MTSGLFLLVFTSSAQTVSHPDLQGPEHQDWWHRSLFWLSKNSGLFPQSYLLKDINVSQRRVFDDEGDVRKGHYGEQPLHLYVAWIRKQVELGPTTEVCLFNYFLLSRSFDLIFE